VGVKIKARINARRAAHQYPTHEALRPREILSLRLCALAGFALELAARRRPKPDDFGGRGVGPSSRQPKRTRHPYRHYGTAYGRTLLPIKKTRSHDPTASHKGLIFSSPRVGVGASVNNSFAKLRLFGMVRFKVLQRHGVRTRSRPAALVATPERYFHSPRPPQWGLFLGSIDDLGNIDDAAPLGAGERADVAL
jgi:hypothetical protein